VSHTPRYGQAGASRLALACWLLPDLESSAFQARGLGRKLNFLPAPCQESSAFLARGLDSLGAPNSVSPGLRPGAPRE